MSKYREKLQSLLRELFQFDSADLDFGFYAVMNQKRDVIEKFISEDLPNLISEGLETVATQNRGEVEAAFEKARQRVIDTLGEDAFDGDALKEYPSRTPAGKAYLAAKEKLDNVFVPEDVEAQIYNDLYTFFARYYDDGDFISQRRYGASDKYAVPYNGEEVHLHWANYDQYYVKTGAHFQNYSFVVPGGVGLENTNVQVRLTKVDVPRDNVKGDKRFFVYTGDQPIDWDEENRTLVIPMEYRPLTPEESSFVGKKQKKQELLLEAAYEAILAAITDKRLKARLTEVDEKKKTVKDRLMYHLSRYAAENTRDFFVHKDLGGFLRREFDYYLKAEVLRLEDIDFSDTIFAERKAAQLKTTRRIGEAIIRFLDQLERFQKQLFLKQKFVLQSGYCLTLDKIPPEHRAEFYPEILANTQQLEEWKKLYGITVTAETDLDSQPHLMLDTLFFSMDFNFRLLACFERLTDVTDGLLVHGDNFQALKLLYNSYKGQVKCIYIDPPYNTGPSEILYKNSYKDSSWLSLMENRLNLTRTLMDDSSSVLVIAIDDYEMAHLCELVDRLFYDYERDVVIVNHHPQGSGGTNISRTHEYALFVTPKNKRVLRGSETEAGTEYRPFMRSGTAENNFRYGRPNSFYAVLVDPESFEVKGVEPPPGFDEEYPKSDLPNGLKRLYPIAADGSERVWRLSYESGQKAVESRTLICRESLTLYQVIEHHGRYTPIYSNWIGKRFNAGSHGTNLITHLFGDRRFSYPKSLFTVQDTIRAIIRGVSRPVIVDYFAGSGTTGHAVMNLNKEGLKGKYILVEMGEYFNTVLKPRIQKVAYADDWRDGKPLLSKKGQTTINGQSHMFQYIRLESYDDTFHNIRFREDTGLQMKLFDEIDYLLGYMLDHETAGSPTLLDIEQFKRPFDYKLLVTGDDGVLQEQPVDLVTTFNFLLGLAVQTIRRYEWNGSPYVRVTGTTPDGVRVCVLWRNGRPANELDSERDWVLANVLNDVTYDKLYVNGENVLPGALLIEDAFKRQMFEGVN